MDHVSKLNIILYWILLFNTGIKNQKLVEPQTTEKGVSPNNGINVLGLFSEKLFLFQLDG